MTPRIVTGLLLALCLSGPLSAQADACGAGWEQAQLKLIDAQLRQQLAAPGLKLELTPMASLPVLAQPSARLLTHGPRSRLAIELSGRACDGGRQVSSTQWFKLRALTEAWVYGRNSKAERPLTEAEPRQETVDVAALQVSPEDLAADLQGMWLRQAVNENMPVLKRQLQAEPLVERSAPVSVVVYGPNLMLRTQGKAMRPGALGETIPVMVDGADSSLLAIVTAKGEVHVEK